MRTELISNIVKAVKIILDENDVNLNVLTTSQDQVELDTLIKGQITPAVRYIHMNAPAALLDGVPMPNAPILSSNGGGSGYINMDTEFMRPLLLQMTGWAKPVTVFMSDTDPDYVLQTSQYRGIKGNQYKPVCVLTSGVNGSTVVKRIEFYSVAASDNNPTIARSACLLYPKINGTGLSETIMICQNVYEAILYMTAGLTAQSIKDKNAEALINTAKGLIQ